MELVEALIFWLSIQLAWGLRSLVRGVEKLWSRFALNSLSCKTLGVGGVEASADISVADRVFSVFVRHDGTEADQSAGMQLLSRLRYWLPDRAQSALGVSS
ncbi:hypothetical protein SH668x_001486 [Planctomicrobium sp. SH668]|uniref:hypothetical protein n=1 Tax=Planctomicrobium sp. SH668 TaxID=3448126 RepID=UPI003F5B5576